MDRKRARSDPSPALDGRGVSPLPPQPPQQAGSLGLPRVTGVGRKEGCGRGSFAVGAGGPQEERPAPPQVSGRRRHTRMASGLRAHPAWPWRDRLAPGQISGPRFHTHLAVPALQQLLTTLRVKCHLLGAAPASVPDPLHSRPCAPRSGLTGLLLRPPAPGPLRVPLSLSVTFVPTSSTAPPSLGSPGLGSGFIGHVLPRPAT